jgi:hypothetical protein
MSPDRDRNAPHSPLTCRTRKFRTYLSANRKLRGCCRKITEYSTSPPCHKFLEEDSMARFRNVAKSLSFLTSQSSEGLDEPFLRQARFADLIVNFCGDESTVPGRQAGRYCNLITTAARGYVQRGISPACDEGQAISIRLLLFHSDLGLKSPTLYLFKQGEASELQSVQLLERSARTGRRV